MRLFLIALFAPTAALAHVGDHSEGVLQSLTHALTQPDHLLIALGVAALGYALFRWTKG